MLTEDGDYIIWTELIAAAEGSGVPVTIFVSITDGNKSWECFLEERDIPLPRRAQGWTHHVPILLSALRMEKVNVSDVSPDFTLEGESLTLTITERIHGSTLKSLLLKRSLSETCDAKGSMKKILRSSIQVMAANRGEILLLRDKVTIFSQSVNQLQQNLDDVTGVQDGMQTEMLKNMCIILNSKSSEIRFLQSSLSAGTQRRDSATITSLEVSSRVAEPLPSSLVRTKRAPAKPKKKGVAGAIKAVGEIESETRNSSILLPSKNVSQALEDYSGEVCGNIAAQDSIIDIDLDSAANFVSDPAINISSNKRNHLVTSLKQKKKRKLEDSSDDSEPDDMMIS